MPIPDFANEAIFPAFDGLPIEDAGAAEPPSYAASSAPPSYVPPPPPDPPSYSDSQSGSGSAAATSLTLTDTSATSSAVTPKPSSHDVLEEWFLVAEVKQNMTITKPTLVVVDRGGTEFAVTFEDRGIDLPAGAAGVDDRCAEGGADGAQGRQEGVREGAGGAGYGSQVCPRWAGEDRGGRGEGQRGRGRGKGAPGPVRGLREGGGGGRGRSQELYCVRSCAVLWQEGGLENAQERL
ncbi:uncharacterized protein GLRG_07526 [Colletotrichum graminicola M1.001]|uniref:Uncharacterized protein n=1 Tax=Colletotrichum graminicola (strain M1.001 / M2 / FGSC 10212) TaxID=645133 RepID=E3QNE4_COLGM|nr:uncharacterized protein GLRG_07526 [Colletotrichum graminicola M1.001]EFQ32382.1 hypothetical protein GLRG_07526 [Colletotrichum graminicola M1.001]